MKKIYTVVGYDSASGQILLEPVAAKNEMHAFRVASKTLGVDVDWVCCMPGYRLADIDIFFPGESVVSSETVLEQKEVFG